MRIFLLAAALLVLVGCSKISVQEQSLTAVRLDIGKGICSGTAIAPDVILTAAHCFGLSEDEDTNVKDEQGPPTPPKKDEQQGPPTPDKQPKKDDPKEDKPEPLPTTMKVNGVDVKIFTIVSDHNDHVMVKVDFQFEYVATLVGKPEVGKHIHYWGNPGGEIMLYREGYVTSFHHSMAMMDVNGFFGDSGAGIFDENGHVVGVMNVINVHQHHGLDFHLMGSAALEFTEQQYEMLGVSHY